MPSRSSPMVSLRGFPNIQRERPSQWPNEQTGGKSGRSAGRVSRVSTGVYPFSDLLASPPAPVRQHSSAGEP